MSEHSHLEYNTADIDNVTAQERSEFNLVSMLKPEIKRDGNQWCVLFGKDLQSGVAGFGDSIHQAAMDFNSQFYKKIESNEKGTHIFGQSAEELTKGLTIKAEKEQE